MLIGIDISRTTRAQHTGTEWYSLALTQALLELPSAHTWRLYFNQPPAPGVWPARAGVELKVMPWLRAWTHVRLSAEMLIAPPDVLFVPAHVLPALSPRRCVVTVHDLGYRYYPEAHTPASRYYLELSTRWNVWRSTLALADSEATRRDLVSVYSAPADKVRVVYPGRDETLRRAAPETIAAVTRRLDIDGAYILHVGTLQPRKNLARLIEAYAGLRAGWAGPGPAPLLVLAGGRGWLSQSIFETARRLGLEASVRFVGYVNRADLPALLSGASLFVFPSLYEGFGFPVLEAMACETPVICSNASSLPEVAGDAALLIDPLDTPAWTAAMYAVLRDADLAARLVDAGRRNVQRFSWGRAARQALDVLEEAGRR